MVLLNNIQNHHIHKILLIDHFVDEYVQESLFTSFTDTKKENVHKALDRIKDRFGESSIHWGQTDK